MRLKLGIVTYNIAKDWDIDTIIGKCSDLGYEGVELRTTHCHKVEVNLSKKQRKEICKKFEDSPVKLAEIPDSPEPERILKYYKKLFYSFQ